MSRDASTAVLFWPSGFYRTLSPVVLFLRRSLLSAVLSVGCVLLSFLMGSGFFSFFFFSFLFFSFS